MKRGDLYRVVHHSGKDPRKYRVFVIVSRQIVIDSRLSTVVCAPIYSSQDGLSTQVLVGTDEGLKHDSSMHCDELISLHKTVLTNYVGSLSPSKIDVLNQALRIALDLPE
ncbi:MAG TPA: type II toxin-antitoxin system PemK/MazF family toxin [Nitrospirales bacterium]|nr:MazF family transcriptional regulator [Nitrospiraceae bacterium]HNP29787.1 type II toxin-antitoxin system PemK/MazF family toxin [Nitrospirales bacterium]